MCQLKEWFTRDTAGIRVTSRRATIGQLVVELFRRSRSENESIVIELEKRGRKILERSSFSRSARKAFVSLSTDANSSAWKVHDFLVFGERRRLFVISARIRFLFSITSTLKFGEQRREEDNVVRRRLKLRRKVSWTNQGTDQRSEEIIKRKFHPRKLLLCRVKRPTRFTSSYRLLLYLCRDIESVSGSYSKPCNSKEETREVIYRLGTILFHSRERYSLRTSFHDKK